jgi:hypothetical protein
MSIPGIGLTKLSFVYFFRRIFMANRTKSTFGNISSIVIVLLLLWASAFFFWTLFACAHGFSARWSTVAEFHAVCPSSIKSVLALAISDVLTDFMVLILPVPMVLQLRMTARRKLLVLAVFALGTIAIVASVIRLVLFVNLAELATGILSEPNEDNNLIVTRALYWSMLESGLGLIACCLPMLYALSPTGKLRSLVESACSLTSLGSQSRWPYRSQNKPSSQTRHGNGSTASTSAIVPGQSNSAYVESYEMGDSRRVPTNADKLTNGKIWVDRTIELHNSPA